MDDLQPFFDMLLGPLGLLIALIWVVLGVLRGWWVPGTLYRKMEQDRDEWKNVALRALTATEKAVTLVERQ